MSVFGEFLGFDGQINRLGLVWRSLVMGAVLMVLSTLTAWALATPAPNAAHAATHPMHSVAASAVVAESLLTALTRRPPRGRWAFPEASPFQPCSRARAALAW